MPRRRRRFHAGYCHHVTVRCNNRDFNLATTEARIFILHALSRALPRFDAKLYAVALMKNHVHDLFQTRDPEDMPRLMHWLNWYVAIGLNRLLKRSGHFWEGRYHAVAVSNRDQRHVLNVLRYIHGNPFAAGAAPGFRNTFTNFGSYASGKDGQLTTWHPQFLRLGHSLAACCDRYRNFCLRYRPLEKCIRRSIGWGGRGLLRGVRSELERKARFGSRRRRTKQADLFDDQTHAPTPPLRDDSPHVRRPPWVPREPKVPKVPKVPGTKHSEASSPWLQDPIRTLFRRFRIVNAPRSGYPREIPWHRQSHMLTE